MANSLAPGFARLNLHSNYGLHSMTHQLFGLTPNGLGTTIKTADDNDVVPLDAFNDYVDLLRPFFRAHVVFDTCTIFNQPTVDDLPVPVLSFGFTSKIGTSTGTGWDKAVQTTISYRTEGVNILKVVLLDSESGNSFDPILVASADPSTSDLTDYMLSDDCVICGQDNTRAVAFIKETSTLNEKLRKQYRLT